MQAGIQDDNPRPLKRQCLEDASTSSTCTEESQEFKPIPPSVLLLALPSLLIHPPTHRNHETSLQLSLAALKKCLDTGDIDGDLECCAWTAIAEVGMISGMHDPRIKNEVEKAVGKALLIAQKLPSLRHYRSHLSLLSGKIAFQHQDNAKHAIQITRRLINSYLPSEPLHVVYAAHLSYISFSENENLSKLLDAIQDLQNLATKNKHDDVVHLARVIRLRALTKEGECQGAGEALSDAEQATGLNLDNEVSQAPLDVDVSPVITTLRLHILVMGVVYFTYAGDSAKAASRLTRLHELLDKRSLDSLGATGVVEFPLSGHKPLFVQMTHPRVLYLLAFLVSSTSKRNPVGRKPKRKVFANEGLSIIERELCKEIAIPQWASQSEAEELYARLHKIKADLLCELVANSICRSEFDDAERNLNLLIAHTRSTSLFPAFAARISLHHAHLAHALSQTERALQCYRVAAHLSRPRYGDYPFQDDGFISTPTKRTPIKRPFTTPKKRGTSTLKKRAGASATKKRGPAKWKEKEPEEDDDLYPEDRWVHAAARAGEIWIRLGMFRQGASNERPADSAGDLSTDEFEELCHEGSAVARQCEGLGGTLKAIGEVLKACLTSEVLKAKGHLRRALDLTSLAQDNHLRALVIALTSSHYFHTARDHAGNMLTTCEQLVAGLGAQPRLTSSRPPSTNGKRETTARPPLVDTDNANRQVMAGRNGEQSVITPKPGNKRKASDIEGENCTLDKRPSVRKEERSDAVAGDSSPSNPKKNDGVGNAHLRLWIGERFLELSRWASDEMKVEKQEAINRQLREAVRAVEQRVSTL
ncbi:hypothetical protein AMATHDRAFT_66920 [Amanita thiersii Skay4041]|uniref:Uncharacterized protein n=1 Tax=Amanita thiersii Skay4041 TaxID=703135 RepID=A0A2A9NAY8_9AGAR|nr:hypothetical protein AMATHDRAFT_66920 [Amanita thiersii Skay4041]